MSNNSNLQLILIIFLILCFGSCKKESKEADIPMITWISPSINDTFMVGDEFIINTIASSNESIVSITPSLKNTTTGKSQSFETLKPNERFARVDQLVQIDSSFHGGEYIIEIEVQTSINTNHYKRRIYINSITKMQSSIMAVSSSTYGRFTVTKYDNSIQISESNKVFNYEYDHGLGWNNALYFATRGNGGFIKIDNKLNAEVLTVNDYNVVDFVQYIGVGKNTIYISTTEPTSEIFGYNSSNSRSFTAGLQLDRSVSITEIGTFLFSIEKANNDNEYSILSYNTRTGGYISTQIATNLQSIPYTFSFNDENQFYFAHKIGNKVQIERYAKNQNDISIITKLNGELQVQKPVEIDDNSVILIFKNKLVEFTKNHIASTLNYSFSNLKGVRYQKSSSTLVLFSDSEIKLVAYPSMIEIASKTNLSGIRDVQFITD